MTIKKMKASALAIFLRGSNQSNLSSNFNYGVKLIKKKLILKALFTFFSRKLRRLTSSYFSELYKKIISRKIYFFESLFGILPKFPAPS